jgi:hypothetical protein
MRKLLLLTVALLVATPTFAEAQPIKKEVCIGGVEHYLHGSKTYMWVWNDISGGMITADCGFDKTTPEGKAVMRACGSIVDVVGKELRQACRIEGLFRLHDGKVRMELLKVHSVKLVRTITCFGILKEHNQAYAKLDNTCLVAKKDLGPCSIGKTCSVIGTFTKVKRDELPKTTASIGLRKLRRYVMNKLIAVLGLVVFGEERKVM